MNPARIIGRLARILAVLSSVPEEASPVPGLRPSGNDLPGDP